jgi:hypothetical protein
VADGKLISGRISSAGTLVSGRTENVARLQSGRVKSVGGLVFPVDVAPGPVLPAWATQYWHGEDLPASGDPISSWVDRLASVSLAQTDPVRRPVVAVDGGGYKSSSHDGINDYLDATITLTQPCTVMLYASYPTSRVQHYTDSAGGPRIALYSASLLFYAFAGTLLSTSISTTSGKKLIGGAYNGGSSRVRGDVDATGSAGANNATSLRVGASSAATVPLLAKIYAIVVAQGYAASATDMDDLATYLATQHGVPS